MIKVDGNDVEIQIKNFEVGELLKEYTILSYGIYHTLKKDFPDYIEKFNLLLKEITVEDNFFIKCEECKTERVVKKCDL